MSSNIEEGIGNDERLTDERSNEIILDEREANPLSATPAFPEPATVSQENRTAQETKEQAPATPIEPNSTNNVCFVLLGWRQIRAVMTKIFLQKYRTPFATFMEIFTPVLMMLVLVAAYQLSEVTFKSAQTYDTVQLDIPGPWIDLATELWEARGGNEPTPNPNVNTTSNTTNSQKLRQLKMKQVMMDFFDQQARDGYDTGGDDDDDTVSWFHDTMAQCKWQIWNHPIMPWHSSTHQSNRRLQFASDEESTNVDDDVLIDDDNDDLYLGGDDEIYDLLNKAQKQVRRILKNPMVVPTFDQYVGTSRVLSALIGAEELPRIFTDSTFGRQWGNLLTLGTLHLSPRSSPVVTAFYEYLNETYPLLLNTTMSDTSDDETSGDSSWVSIRLHESEGEAVKYIDETHSTDRTWALIDLSRFPTNLSSRNDSNMDEPQQDDIQFTIRMNYTTIPNTNEITDFVTIGLNTQYQQYYLSGYLTLQQTLNEFALSYYGSQNQENGNDGSCNVTSNGVWSMPMPTASYSQNSFFLAVGYLLGLTIVMAYLYPTSRLIKLIVEEKETKLKETMFIMGLKPWAHWIAWMSCSLLIFGVIAVLVTNSLSNNVLTYSDPVYLFWWIFFFSTATVGFCFALASLFSKAKLASIIGPMALFATLLPRFIFFGYNRYEASSAKKWASLLPATAFSFGADIVADYEYGEIGIQDWNSGEGDYSFNTSIGFLVFDTILYIFLGWYLDQVVPREYGSARPMWFLCTPSFWCSCFFRRRTRRNHQATESATNLSATIHGEYSDLAYTNGSQSRAFSSPQDHETIDNGNLVPRIVARDIFKVYSKKKGTIPAVNHLDLTLFESQITTLLGHNGAGKSTTISLLTGLFRPTSGDATIYGNSITHNPAEARRSIGICPQQNVLFDTLTVKEHIFFYQRLKGVNPTRQDAEDKAKEIGLEDFFHVTSSALSGGNKRKLCVASALCGDPKFLVLDEPTSGMDPHARRKTWDVLRRRRLGRSILLCTHFMDEAEILSDRIAIMKAGALRCSGSPLFLKQRFGVGYNFTVVLEVDESDDAEGLPSSVDSSIETKAHDLLIFTRTFVQSAQIQRIGGKEVTIRLPTEEEGSFPQLFDELQLQRTSLSIGAFGVENASLEEVFIDLADGGDHEESSGVETEDEMPPLHNSASTTFFTQIGLGYWKRFVIQRRDLRGLFFSVVVPVLLVALVLLILTINVPVVGPAIELSPSLYKSSNVGTAALTDIVVGGGASSGAKGDLDSRYETLRNWSVSDYENLNFDRRREVNSSQALSHFLLDSINLRDHHERFGSYSLYDNVSMEINVDWAAMESGTESILSLLDDAIGSNQQLESSFSVKPVEVLDLLELVNASFSLLVPVNETNLALELIFDGANFTRAQFEDEVEMILQSVSGESINETAFIAELSGVILDSIVVSGLNVTSLGAWLVGNQTLNEFLEQIGFNLDDASGLNGTVDEWRFGRVIADVSTSLDVASFDSLNLTLAIEALDGSGYWFNERSIANGMGNIASAFIAANSDSGTSTISNDVSSFLSEGAQDGPISESSAILVVWLMTQLVSDSTQDSDALELTFAPRDILKTLGVELDEEIPIVLESSSVSFHPSESIVSFSDLIVTLGSLEFESDVVNVSLSPSSFSESAPTGEETYTFDVQAESSILHNSSSPHAVATFNQHYADFVFKSCIGKTSARLVSENHPLPLTTQQSLEIKTILSVLASMFILIPYCFIPGAFIVFLVREKASKSKHLQLVSGTNITAYWMSAYFYDVSRFFLLTVLVMAVFLMYGKDAAQVFVGTWEAFGCTALLTFGYGLSVLPFAYLLARRFDNHSSAQIAVIGVIFISGFVAVNAYYIMDSIEKTRSIAQTLRPLFRLWPAYNVGDGLIAMSRAFWEREVLFQENSPLDWDVAGKPLGLLYGLAIPYFLMLLFVEFSHEGGAGGIGRLLRRLNEGFENIALKCSGVKVEENGGIALDDGLADNPIGKDSDVLAEEAFVREEFETLKKSAPVLFHELWKVYLPSIGLFGAFMSSTKHFVRRLLCCGRRGKSDVQERRAVQPKRAVRGVSTAVQEGEIYALLGANGAGKTTTLGMLTGDVSPTSGNIYVAGHDATGRLELDGMTRARKHIGFCPQVDPLLDQMSVRETLTLFGRLRGFGCDTIDNVVGRIMERLLLIPHASKTCESLSGGNKRKLSLGIALIGGPTVLLIDESSSGLDPLAKRRMWNLISSVAKNKTVLLTTHSMEEAEALCTRAGIMAKGQLLCLGSVQHLKTKYLDGYTIDVFCLANSSDTQVEELVTEILTIALPGTSLSERHGRWCRFDLTNASEIGLGTTFKNLEDLKNNESVLESYSISQCSLEQVFVQLSNKERDDAATNSSIATTPAEQSHDVSVENLSSSGSNV